MRAVSAREWRIGGPCEVVTVSGDVEWAGKRWHRSVLLFVLCLKVLDRAVLWHNAEGDVGLREVRRWRSSYLIYG